MAALPASPASAAAAFRSRAERFDAVAGGQCLSSGSPVGGGVTAAQRPLAPLVGVRIPAPQLRQACRGSPVGALSAPALYDVNVSADAAVISLPGREHECVPARQRCCTTSAAVRCRWRSSPPAKPEPEGDRRRLRRPGRSTGTCPTMSSRRPARAGRDGRRAGRGPRPIRRVRRWSCSAATFRSSRRKRSPAWWPATRDAGAAATVATAELEDPTGYGRVVRAADGRSKRSSRPRTPVTPPGRRWRSARSTVASTSSTRLPSPRPSRRWAATTPRASATCPTFSRRGRGRGKGGRRPRRRPQPAARGERPCRPRQGPRARAGGNRRAAHALGRRHRRPVLHADRRQR